MPNSAHQQSLILAPADFKSQLHTQKSKAIHVDNKTCATYATNVKLEP